MEIDDPDKTKKVKITGGVETTDQGAKNVELANQGVRGSRGRCN